ncbi:hypothetical protein [Streptomyces sp. NPDC054783]
MRKETDKTYELSGDTHADHIPKADGDGSIVRAGQLCAAPHGVRGRAYTAKTGFHLYPICGTSDDYACSRDFANAANGRIPGSTVEWGTRFHPPWAEMENIILAVEAGLVQFCLTAL